MIESFLDGRLIVKVGDITMEEVDAVVNAANSTLLGGGGVDGAIHRRGGPAILEECRKIRQTEYPDGLPTGKAVITTGGNLPARHVIHTVGPIYGQNNGRDAELLAHCYRNSIRLATEKGLSTIAFPSISTGAFYYPKHQAAPVVVDAVRSELEAPPAITVILVFHNTRDLAIFLKHSRLK
ncbi:MAG: O-acetyl-ADP-ribose deacetylase [Pyrinomonadaceae bacterium]